MSRTMLRILSPSHETTTPRRSARRRPSRACIRPSPPSERLTRGTLRRGPRRRGGRTPRRSAHERGGRHASLACPWRDSRGTRRPGGEKHPVRNRPQDGAVPRFAGRSAWEARCCSIAMRAMPAAVSISRSSSSVGVRGSVKYIAKATEHPALGREFGVDQHARRPNGRDAPGHSSQSGSVSMSVTMTRSPRYMAVPHGAIHRADGQAIDCTDVLRRAGSGPHRGGPSSMSSSSSRMVQKHDRRWFFHHAYQRSSTAGRRAACRDHLEHLVLRGTERLFAAPLCDVTRDREDLDDGAVGIR